MAELIAYCTGQELPTSEGAPASVHLLPLGAFTGRDGRSWTLDTPDEVIRRFAERKIDLPIDYEHQSQAPGKGSGPTPAAGWITALQKREDGIWGNVTWTDTARNLIQERAYRFLSPTFRYAKGTGKVGMLRGAALVHEPNLELTALAHERADLQDDGGDATALTTIAGALGLGGTAALPELLDAINALSTPDPAQYVPLSAVKDLLKDRNEKISNARAAEAETAVNTAMDGGHITPGMRDWALALCRSDRESFDAFLASTPAPFAHLFEPSNLDRRPPGPGQLSASDAETAICQQLGLEPGRLSR